MLTHDQLAFAVNKLHPQLVRWKDFWTAHPVARSSYEQVGEADIIAWQPTNIPQPSIETLRAVFVQYEAEWQARKNPDTALRQTAPPAMGLNRPRTR